MHRILYELADIAPRVAKDQAALVPPGVSSQLSAVLNTASADQRSELLNKISPAEPIEFSAPNVLYATAALANVELETGLTSSDVLPLFDGTFDVYETAALVALSRSASATDLEQLSDAARLVVQRAKDARAAPAVLETAVRQNNFIGGRIVGAPVPTFVARAIYRLLNPSEQTTLALVSRQFSTLIEEEPLEQYRLRNAIAFRLLDDFWQRSTIFVSGVYESSQRLQVHLMEGLHTVSVLLESEAARRRLAASAAAYTHFISGPRRAQLIAAANALDELIIRTGRQIDAATGNTATELGATQANYARLLELTRQRIAYDDAAIQALFPANVRRMQAQLADATSRAETESDDRAKASHKQTVATLAAELKPFEVAIDEFVKADLTLETGLIRASLALLTVRPKLGADSVLTRRVFASTFDKRTIDLKQRIFGHIANHPRVKARLLRPGLASLVADVKDLRLMEAESIMRDRIYRPQNIYAKLNNDLTNVGDETILTVFDTCKRFGIDRTNAGAAVRGALAFTSTEIPAYAYRTTARPLGVIEPALVGRYYVYANDLPSPNPYEGRVGDVGIDRVAHPLLFDTQPNETGTPFAYSPSSHRSLDQLLNRGKAPTWLPLDDNSATSPTTAVASPVALVERVLNEDGLPSLRVECYVVAAQYEPVTEDVQKLQRENRKKTIELVGKVNAAETQAIRAQNEIMELPLEVPVPNELLELQRAATIATRAACIEFLDFYDSIPPVLVPIVAAVVWQTPPIANEFSRLPESIDDLWTLMNMLASTRYAFQLTRAVTRADYALFVGIEQFLSATPVIYSKAYGDNPQFGEYRRSLERQQPPPLVALLASFDRADEVWQTALYTQALKRDTNMALYVVAKLEERFIEVFGTLDEWMAAVVDTRTPAGKYSELEYLVLRFMVMTAAFMRLSHDGGLANLSDFANMRSEWPATFVRAHISYGGLISYLVGRTLEPVFLGLVGDTPRRAVIEAALSTFHIGKFANPFSEFDQAKRDLALMMGDDAAGARNDNDDDVDDKPKRARTDNDDDE